MRLRYVVITQPEHIDVPNILWLVKSQEGNVIALSVSQSLAEWIAETRKNTSISSIHVGLLDECSKCF